MGAFFIGAVGVTGIILVWVHSSWQVALGLLLCLSAQDAARLMDKHSKEENSEEENSTFYSGED